MVNKTFLFLLVGLLLISLGSSAITDNISAYYKLDETSGTTAYDSVARYNGTYVNTPTLGQQGKVNYSINLTSGTDAVNITTLARPVSNITVNAWMRSIDHGSVKVIVGADDVNKGQLKRHFTTYAYLGRFTVGLFTATGGEDYFYVDPSIINITDGLWHMVTFTYNTTNVYLYVDGVNRTVTLSGGLPSGNLGLFTNGSTTSYGTGISIGQNSPYDNGQQFIGGIDEVGIWNRSLSATEISQLYNSNNGSSYPFSVTATINTPTTGTSYLVTDNITITWSSQSYSSLTNTTLFVNDIGNYTTNISGITNTTTIYRIFSTANNYDLKAMVCDTLGCTNSSLVEISTGLYAIRNTTYQPTTYETQNQNIGVNISYINSDVALAVILNYDGTNYTTTNTGTEGIGVYNTNLDVPIINGSSTKDFYWFIQVDDGTPEIVTTTTYQQTVNPITLTLCNGTYTDKVLNFTYYDETTGLIINTTANRQTFQGTFNYWVGTGITYKNYSINDINRTNTTYTICISPYNNSDNVIKTNFNSFFEAQNYASNTYYLTNATLLNTTTTIPLWLLPTAEASEFTITAYRGVSTFNEGIITISKYFEGEGIYKTIGIAQTDENGKFSQYLERNKKYSFDPYKDGTSYTTIFKTAICSATPCEMDLQITQATYDIFDGYYGNNGQGVTYTLTYNKTTKMFTATFNDVTGLADYFRLQVAPSYLNNTDTTVCNSYSYSTSGTLSCNMSNYTGDFVGKLYISRSPEKLVDLLGFVANSIQESLGTVSVLVSLIILIVIVFSGLKNPVIALVLIPLALVVLKLFDFLPLSWLTVSAITFLALLIIGRIKT